MALDVDLQQADAVPAQSLTEGRHTYRDHLLVLSGLRLARRHGPMTIVVRIELDADRAIRGVDCSREHGASHRIELQVAAKDAQIV
jgi:hypothetical protein